MHVHIWRWFFWSGILFIVLGGVFAIGLTLGLIWKNEFELPVREVGPLYSSGLQTKDFFDGAYAAAEPGDSVSVVSAVSAHHLLVAKEIASLFETIGSGSVKTVIVVSPNHFDAGVHPAQVSFGNWETPYGMVESSTKARVLANRGGIVWNEEKAFEQEHGIGALTPFVAHSFPNAKIIPLVIDDSLTADEAKVVAGELYDVAPDAILIASSDMSHYLPSLASDYHDEVTENCLARGIACLENLNLEVDTNAVLQVLGEWNRLQGTQVWTQTYHGNSLAMGIGDAAEENTSHILGYFTKGAPVTSPSASIHFVGDIMLDRGVRKAIDAAGGDPNFPWQHVMRFLQGSDLRVGNLEGTVNEQQSTYTYDPPFRFVFSPSYVEAMKPFIDVVSLANNHVWDVGSAGETETHTWLDSMGIPWFASYKSPVPRYDQDINGIPITLIGYHSFQPDEDLLLETIATAQSDGRFIIVMPHWGVEYEHQPQTAQRALAQKMINAGADLIMAGHAHVPEGIEVIDGVPVLYSLGNFVFDQQIPETWSALTAGVIITDEKIEINLLPVDVSLKAPKPMEGDKATALLKHLAEYSDDVLKEQIINGKLIFDRYETN
ncbi:MAG: AmmeMemoRadiSam system protein B [Patescibacteria group bacterium]